MGSPEEWGGGEGSAEEPHRPGWGDGTGRGGEREASRGRREVERSTSMAKDKVNWLSGHAAHSWLSSEGHVIDPTVQPAQHSVDALA